MHLDMREVGHPSKIRQLQTVLVGGPDEVVQVGLLEHPFSDVHGLLALGLGLVPGVARRGWPGLLATPNSAHNSKQSHSHVYAPSPACAGRCSNDPTVRMQQKSAPVISSRSGEGLDARTRRRAQGRCLAPRACAAAAAPARRP